MFNEYPDCIERLISLNDIIYRNEEERPNEWPSSITNEVCKFLLSIGVEYDLKEFFEYQTCCAREVAFGDIISHHQSREYTLEARNIYQQTRDVTDNRPTVMGRKILKKQFSTPTHVNIFNSLFESVLNERDRIIQLNPNWQALLKDTRYKTAKHCLATNDLGLEYNKNESDRKTMVFSKVYPNNRKMNVSIDLYELNKHVASGKLICGSPWGEEDFKFFLKCDLIGQFRGNNRVFSFYPVNYFLLDLFLLPSHCSVARNIEDIPYLVALNFYLLEYIDNVLGKNE